MSAKFIQNNYSSTAHSAYLRHKIGLASWEIRPWISLMQQRMQKGREFATQTSTMKKHKSIFISRVPDISTLLTLFSLLVLSCYGQEIANADSTLRPRLQRETTTLEPTESPTTTQSTELAGGSTITAVSTISPYLKPGASYLGKTSSTRLADTLTSVAVLVAIDNWTKWSLIEPENEMNSGKIFDSELPESIQAGQSEMVLFGKDSGISGVSGALTYRIEMHPKECDVAHYLQVMWSVPYNLNTYSAYMAVGVSDSYFNSSYTTNSLYNTLYYYSGTFERAEAGIMVEYIMTSSNDSTTDAAPKCKPVKVRGTMTPDTYKPIVAISVLPTLKEDGFLSGKYFDEPESDAESINNYSLQIPIICVIATNLMLLYSR